jgi:hypothetical protein
MIKAERVFESMTPEEKAYFIACTDIFHDEPYTCVGRPGKTRDRTVTLCINQEKSLGIADFPLLNQTANWDLNLVSFPFVTTQQFISCWDKGSTITAPTTPINVGMGGITPMATQSGITFTPTSYFSTSYMPTSGPLTLTSALFPEVATASVTQRYTYEVLAIGFEVVNTTAPLYASGSVTSYRAPVELNDTQSFFGGISLSYKSYSMPPTNLAQAALYPDSIVGEASKGIYCNHTLQGARGRRTSGTDNLLLSITPTSSIANGDSWASKSAFNTAAILGNSPTILGDHDIVGAWFAGLSPQTSLTVRYRVWISYTPAPDDSTLISLATQSPPYNPHLDTLLSLTQMRLPPSVPVSMNAKGDWWRNIAKITSKYAPLVGGVFGPEGLAIGTGIGTAAGLISNIPRSSPGPSRNSGAGQIAQPGQPYVPVQGVPQQGLFREAVRPAIMYKPQRSQIEFAQPLPKRGRSRSRRPRGRRSRSRSRSLAGSGAF